MVPGTQKRGKAAKQALEYSSKSSAMSAREKETASQVKDTLAVAAMVGECKIMPAGSALASTSSGGGKKGSGKKK